MPHQRNPIEQNQSCKMVGSETRRVAVVLRFNQERSHMSNVYYLLDEKMDMHFRTFLETLDKAWAFGITKYNVEQNDRRVRSVFNSSRNLIRSRRQALDRLYLNSSYEKSRSELNQFRKRLTDDPRHVVMSFHKRIAKNNVDLDDRCALAAF
jgi:hypothetical protein